MKRGRAPIKEMRSSMRSEAKVGIDSDLHYLR